MSSKKSINWIGIATAATSSLVIVGSAAYMIYEFVLKPKPVFRAPELGKDFQKLETKDMPLNIFEGPVDENDSKPGEDKPYFLGKDGREKLLEKLKTRLKYGPEIFQLRRIVIGTHDFIDNGAHGVYYPATHEIFINPHAFSKDGGSTSPSADIRAEAIFQIIYHEYGHHIANTYFNSDPTKKSLSDPKWLIYSKSENSTEKENWNVDFLKGFEKDLKYLKADGTVNKETYWNKNDIANTNVNDAKSVGSYLSAGQIFAEANTTVGKKMKDILKKNYYFSPTEAHKFQILPRSDEQYNKFIDSTYYRYSMSELFTRKFQQLTMTNINGSKFYSDGWYHWNGVQKHSSISALAEDAFDYQYELEQNSHVYLDDGPFSNLRKANDHNYVATNPQKAATLFNLYDKHLGHSATKAENITFMMNKNNTALVSVGDSVHIGNVDINKSLIKFGGFIPSGQKYIGIGIKTKDLNGKDVFVKLSDINQMKYTISSKPSLNSFTSNAVQGNSNFYVTKDFINKDKLIGKPLYFIYEDKNKVLQGTKLSSIRTGDEGIASTFREREEELSNNKDYYKAVLNNGDVTIQKG